MQMCQDVQPAAAGATANGMPACKQPPWRLQGQRHMQHMRLGDDVQCGKIHTYNLLCAQCLRSRSASSTHRCGQVQSVVTEPAGRKLVGACLQYGKAKQDSPRAPRSSVGPSKPAQCPVYVATSTAA